MSQTTFCIYESVLGQKLQDLSLQKMEEAAEEEKAIALNKNHVSKNGIPMCTVVADGQWSRRSYGTNFSALSGSVS